MDGCVRKKLGQGQSGWQVAQVGQQFHTPLDAPQCELRSQTATRDPVWTEEFSTQNGLLNFRTKSDAVGAKFMGANGHFQPPVRCGSGEFIPRCGSIFPEDLVDFLPNLLPRLRGVGLVTEHDGPERCANKDRTVSEIRKSGRQSKADAKGIAQSGSIGGQAWLKTFSKNRPAAEQGMDVILRRSHMPECEKAKLMHRRADLLESLAKDGCPRLGRQFHLPGRRYCKMENRSIFGEAKPTVMILQTLEHAGRLVAQNASGNEHPAAGRVLDRSSRQRNLPKIRDHRGLPMAACVSSKIRIPASMRRATSKRSFRMSPVS